MARTIEQIRDSIIAEKELNQELAELNSTSNTAIWRLWAWLAAFSSWVIENLFDEHKAEVDTMIRELRPAYIPWLTEKSYAFQFGFDLVPDETYYDNTGIDEAVVAASKVIKYAKVIELQRGLMFKIAGETAGVRGPVSPAQEAAFTAYINESIKPPVKVRIVNKQPDKLKLRIKVFYNPQILDATGKRLDGTDNTPVQTAITGYIENLTFDGLYVINQLEKTLELVSGVEIASTVQAEVAYESVPFTPIDVYYRPQSGYLTFDDPSDLTIEFIPYVNI